MVAVRAQQLSGLLLAREKAQIRFRVALVLFLIPFLKCRSWFPRTYVAEFVNIRWWY